MNVAPVVVQSFLGNQTDSDMSYFVVCFLLKYSHAEEKELERTFLKTGSYIWKTDCCICLPIFFGLLMMHLQVLEKFYSKKRSPSQKLGHPKWDSNP
ncbi:hypothetical protein TNCT_719031 [Trichonephila clavata]|uniref:Uncharacterized protein n=1 Tax=Trichonephila clavata TaxID=2740835 RepID=A0A8X6KFU1_TRICU|nr:hypothetical protein TNCT_719031 [Trichonephila clavata]